jgi:hypothetical protein
MNFEKESGPIEISSEDFEILTGATDDDPEKKKAVEDLMSKYGLEYDSGDVRIKIGGEEFSMETAREDFGTILERT